MFTQAVRTDAQWQRLAADITFDIFRFRQRAELVEPLMDAPSPGMDAWSIHAPKLRELVDLAAKAVATNTPFADGIGERMVTLAGSLSVAGMMALHDSVSAAGC